MSSQTIMRHAVHFRATGSPQVAHPTCHLPPATYPGPVGTRTQRSLPNGFHFSSYRQPKSCIEALTLHLRLLLS